MAASVQFRPQNRDLGMVMREVDEDLAIFLGMRNSEKDRTDLLLGLESAEFIDINESDSFLIPKASESESDSPATDDNFLNSEIERSDYNWLLSQADACLLSSEVISTQVSTMNHYDISNVDGTPLKSEVESTVEESATQSDCSVQQPASIGDSSSGKKMSSSSVDRKPIRRAATPTARSTSREKPKPSRSSTPTPRTVLPSAKPVAAQARSSTPGRGASRSSTPASRPSLCPSSNSASRSATPTHPPLSTSTSSASNQSVVGRKTATKMTKNPVPSRGTSPTVKPRPSKPTEMLSVSHDGSQKLKPSTIKRPVSASRGRPAAPSAHSALSNAKPRQKSCSPAKVRAPTTTAQKTGPKILSRSRGHSSEGDDVNPVLMGTQMVNRVVNMRKLAPPKQDEYVSHDSQRKASHENSGFGRSLSKSSLDMAIRHMDIGRSIGDTLRPVATGAFSSSARGIRSGSSKSGGISVLESPPSSSCGSSKSSGCINSHFLNGTEFDY